VKLIAALALSMAAVSAFGQQSEAEVIARLKKDLAEIADLQASLLAPPPDIASK
jgi:outer membrane lipoprotein-sorting protein